MHASIDNFQGVMHKFKHISQPNMMLPKYTENSCDYDMCVLCCPLQVSESICMSSEKRLHKRRVNEGVISAVIGYLQPTLFKT